MTVDTVDDVEAAEDHAAMLAEGLRDLARAVDEGWTRTPGARAQLRVARAAAIELLRAHDTEYCRPTCAAQDAEHGTDGHEETCGCVGHSDD